MCIGCVYQQGSTEENNVKNSKNTIGLLREIHVMSVVGCLATVCKRRRLAGSFQLSPSGPARSLRRKGPAQHWVPSILGPPGRGVWIA